MPIHPNKGGSLTKHLNSGTMDSEIIYGDGIHGSMGPSLQTEAIDAKAILDAEKYMAFSRFGNLTHIPLHSGRGIKKRVINPIMSDKNINDQGIDANGVTIENGNLFGSSTDYNNLGAAMPVLTEHGGRVNRVGLTWKTISGSVCNYGFFMEYSADSVNLDNDRQLEMHFRREMVKAATEIHELALGADIINHAGIIKYGGEALSFEDMTGEEGDVISVLTYEGLAKLAIKLDEEGCPTSTKMVKGHRNIDTLTIDAARYAIIGSELKMTLKRIKDLFGNEAFVPVRKYAAAGNIAPNEYGAIDEFRFIINEKMGSYKGVGKAESSNAGYRTTNGKYDVFPMVVVGSGAFTALSMRLGGTSGNGSTKKGFLIYHDKPGSEASAMLDPYRKTGRISIQWTYGFLAERPERIAVYYSVAEL